MTERFLDAKGLVCPLPVLRARKALKDIASGQELRIEATDSNAVQDFRAYCETTGDALLDVGQTGDIYTFVIRKR